MSVGDVDITKRGDIDQLKGNAVGLYSILFLCVTGSAPLAVFIYNTPFTMPYGSGSNGPVDVLLRDDRAHDLLDRVRRDGEEGAGRRRHVHLRQPRPRAAWGLMAGYSLMIGYAIFGVALIGGFSSFTQAKLAAVPASTSTGSGSR